MSVYYCMLLVIQKLPQPYNINPFIFCPVVSAIRTIHNIGVLPLSIDSILVYNIVLLYMYKHQLNALYYNYIISNIMLCTSKLCIIFVIPHLILFACIVHILYTY